MTSPPVQALLEFASHSAVSVSEQSTCVELTIHREEVRILVTVPKGVLEWEHDGRWSSAVPLDGEWESANAREGRRPE